MACGSSNIFFWLPKGIEICDSGSLKTDNEVHSWITIRLPSYRLGWWFVFSGAIWLQFLETKRKSRQTNKNKMEKIHRDEKNPLDIDENILCTIKSAIPRIINRKKTLVVC